jgi:hypothetical protein
VAIAPKTFRICIANLLARPRRDLQRASWPPAVAIACRSALKRGHRADRARAGLSARLIPEPSGTMFCIEDGRRAIMDRRDKMIGRNGDDRVRADPLPARWVIPVLPNAGDTERLAVPPGNRVTLPGQILLKEAVHRHNTAARRCETTRSRRQFRRAWIGAKSGRFSKSAG